MGLLVNFGKRILLHEAAPVDCHRFLCTCLGDSLFELCACYQDINAGARPMQIPIVVDRYPGTFLPFVVGLVCASHVLLQIGMQHMRTHNHLTQSRQFGAHGNTQSPDPTIAVCST